MREFAWDSPPPTPEEFHTMVTAGLRRHIRNQKRRIKALHNNINWIDKEVAKQMANGMDIFELAHRQEMRNAIRKEIKWAYQNVKDTYERMVRMSLKTTIEIQKLKEYRK